MRSIRGYLLVSLILSLTFGSLLVAAFTYFHAAEEIDELYDKSMEDTANGLKHQIEALGFDVAAIKGAHGYAMQSNLKEEENFLVQIWTDADKPVYSTHTLIPFPKQKPRGLHLVMFEGEEWRVYAVEESAYTIQVAQPQESRNEFIQEVTLYLLYPMLGQIPVIGLLIWVAVGFSLLPLSDVSHAIKGRSANSLTPLAMPRVPAEMKPMVEELNALLTRLKAALDNQKRFTADAAHELRTPLTALQLQLGVLKAAKTEDDRAQALEKLQQGIDRSAHVARQLLTMARLDPESLEMGFGFVNLDEIIRAAISQYMELAFSKKIDLGVSQLEPVAIAGDAASLRIMVENLIDNAIRYTPEGGRVDVAAYMEHADGVLVVKDSGIGIAEHERAQVFERFYRVIGTDVEGTGLGLSIVKHIAERHYATIMVDAGIDGAGTAFTVRFANVKRG